MVTLDWTASHAVFVEEMDVEHAEIIGALRELRAAVAAHAPVTDVAEYGRAVEERVEDHCAHEERLMRASRYGSLRWHKRLHDTARRRMRRFVRRLEEGESDAGPALVDYLTGWLHEHTRLPDMMLAAFLRNHRRGLVTMTFRAGTRPIESCAWVDANGKEWDPDR